MFNSDTVKNVRGLVALGGWVVLSLFFMGQAAGYIPSAATRLASVYEGHEAAMMKHDQRQEVLIERLTTALRVMCENGSRTAAEFNNCRNIQ